MVQHGVSKFKLFILETRQDEASLRKYTENFQGFNEQTLSRNHQLTQ